MEELRICRTCKKEKPLSEFNKDKRHSSGYATQCKECKRAYDKASSANREQIQAFCKNIFKYLDNEEIVRTVEKGESAEVQDKELV